MSLSSNLEVGGQDGTQQVQGRVTPEVLPVCEQFHF